MMPSGRSLHNSRSGDKAIAFGCVLYFLPFSLSFYLFHFLFLLGGDNEMQNGIIRNSTN